MTNLKTNEALLRALKEASSRQISPEELKNQRISFIMGTVHPHSEITRDRVREVLAEQEGKKIAK